ncbi:MAG: hypothetical protein M3R39_06805 [Actinomycetota bacterium]|nr:hypothetical protein [Actinomycetota bacterium]
MSLLRREKAAVLGSAVLDFYAEEDGELVACRSAWEGSDALFLLLPGLAFDEHLPYVRIAHGKLQDSAREAVLQEFEDFVDESLDAVRRGDPPLLQDALPLVGHRADDTVVQATVTIRLDGGERRLWAETTYTPKKTRGILFEVALRVCWDWIFTAFRHDRNTLASVLSELQLLFDDYRENGIPSGIRLKGIGRAPFRLWVLENGAVADPRELAPRESHIPLEEKHSAGTPSDAQETQDAELRGNRAVALPRIPGMPDAGTTEAFACIQPRWEELWSERGKRPVEGRLLEAIEGRIKRLDWGSGDLIEQALAGGGEPAIEEGAVGVLLTRIAFGGYLWREAERDVGVVFDPLPIEHVDFALSLSHRSDQERSGAIE